MPSVVGEWDSVDTYFRMTDISMCAVTTAMPTGSRASGPSLIVPAAIMIKARGAFRKAPGTAASMAPTHNAIGIAGKRAWTRRPAVPPRKIAGKTTPPRKPQD